MSVARTLIVVVDDEPDVRDLICHLLEDEGYGVLCLSHPVPATRLRERQERPSLFLLDIMLPDMNGIALAGRLADDGFADIPKIAMSASPRMLQVAEESRLFDTFLSKPFDIGVLLDRVEACLAGPGGASSPA